MELLEQYVQPELMVLVPVLYFVGIWLRRSAKHRNETIPQNLGLLSVALCVMYTLSLAPIANYRDVLHALFVAVTQGLMCAGLAVYTNQIFVQRKKIKQESSRA